MLNQNSLEEIADIYNLLQDIKKEYKEGIQPILIKNSPKLFQNPHTIPKLNKIQINRGLGLTAQNTKILKKNIEEFEKITGQKPVLTRAKKAIASFKIRENMELGLSVTLRGERMYNFLAKLLFFTFAQIRDFRGLSLRSFDKAGNYSLGLKEQLIFPEIDYDDVEQTQGFTITLVLDHTSSASQIRWSEQELSETDCRLLATSDEKLISNNEATGQSSPISKNSNSKSMDKILNGMILLKFLKFPLNECGYYQKYESFSDIARNWEKKKPFKRKRWSQE